MSIEKRTTRQIPASRWWLPGLLSLVLYTPVPAVNAASIETGFSPEGTALQLVLRPSIQRSRKSA